MREPGDPSTSISMQHAAMQFTLRSTSVVDLGAYSTCGGTYWTVRVGRKRCRLIAIETASGPSSPVCAPHVQQREHPAAICCTSKVSHPRASPQRARLRHADELRACVAVCARSSIKQHLAVYRVRERMRVWRANMPPGLTKPCFLAAKGLLSSSDAV